MSASAMLFLASLDDSSTLEPISKRSAKRKRFNTNNLFVDSDDNMSTLKEELLECIKDCNESENSEAFLVNLSNTNSTNSTLQNNEFLKDFNSGRAASFSRENELCHSKLNQPSIQKTNINNSITEVVNKQRSYYQCRNDSSNNFTNKHPREPGDLSRYSNLTLNSTSDDKTAEQIFENKKKAKMYSNQSDNDSDDDLSYNINRRLKVKILEAKLDLLHQQIRNAEAERLNLDEKRENLRLEREMLREQQKSITKKKMQGDYVY